MRIWPFVQPVGAPRLRALLALVAMVLPILPAGPTAAQAQPTARLHYGRPAGSRPLAEQLEASGALRTNGYSGALDPSGFTMTLGPDGAPRFSPAQAGGDAVWDPRFGAPGLNSLLPSAAALSAAGDLYVGGRFGAGITGVPSTDAVARWDGQRWHALLSLAAVYLSMATSWRPVVWIDPVWAATISKAVCGRRRVASAAAAKIRPSTALTSMVATSISP